MNISTPTCNFQSGGNMLQFQPGYQIENREHQTLSHNEYPSFKKQRVCGAFVVNPTRPVTSNNATSGNLVKNKPFNGTWNGNDGHRVISQMQLCRMFYYNSKCSYGGRCRFSHVIPEKVKQDFSGFRDISAKRSRTSGFGLFANASKEFGDGMNPNPRLGMWKTKLCNNWEMTGGCLYGKTCYFAHGLAELHKLGRHNALQSNSRIVPMNVSSTFSTGNDQSGTTCKQPVQDMNCMFKWKELEKNNGIYADWIEDAPLLHSSSNYVKN
ncbi:hypothetical protein Dsin_030742 [Dipteronia sinensis]|uniref:C3H1-type domain-containing protein n=1 Tax=Dipteronia sinensis TaxID=43782 RepID=A0AAD9ZJQ4_9ROSI|nr:hypothetical protein Dsin_030742 [Dipteronia sinensis]